MKRLASADPTADLCRKLDDLVEAFRSIHGAAWPAIVAELAPPVRAAMARERGSSALAVAIPIAKRMAADGHNPGLVLAVAYVIDAAESAGSGPGGGS